MQPEEKKKKWAGRHYTIVFSEVSNDRIVICRVFDLLQFYDLMFLKLTNKLGDIMNVQINLETKTN